MLLAWLRRNNTVIFLILLSFPILYIAYGVFLFLTFYYQEAQSQKQALTIRRTVDILSLGHRIEQYYELYGSYPCASSVLPCDWQEELAKVNHAEPVPNDPETHEPYVYLSNGKSSLVGAKIEIEEKSTYTCNFKGGRDSLWLIYQTAYREANTLCAVQLDRRHLLLKL